MILAGLWLDIGINVEVFLKSFIDELRILYDQGVQIYNDVYKIICSTLCVDSVARCKVMKMKQFNGKFGCTYCKHPGEIVKCGGITFKC